MDSPTPSELAARLDRLGFRALPESMDEFLKRAADQGWTPRRLLAEAARMEEAERARRSLQRRLRNVRLQRYKPMADFDWDWPKKIDRPLIERAFALDFINEGRNLILLGPNGVGKTMIVKNLCLAAVHAGHSALFRTASELLDDLQSDSPELVRRRLKKYARPAVLCIDEVGYLAYDCHAADLLYEVVNRRYEQKSILVTSNRAFKDWNVIFPNATCIVSLLDRLTHHAEVSTIQGDSYRRLESEREAAQRRKKA